MKEKSKAFLSIRFSENYAVQFDELKKEANKNGYILSKSSIVQEALFSKKTLQDVINEKKAILCQRKD